MHPADLNADFTGVTLLPPIGNDEPLVRSYLKHFFVDADATTKEFEPYINDVYLKHLFAETKIVNGLGDAEQWASHAAAGAVPRSSRSASTSTSPSRTRPTSPPTSRSRSTCS